MSVSTEEILKIQRALEGHLSEVERESFRLEVLQNAEFRAAYVRRLWLHSVLRAERDELASLVEGHMGGEDSVDKVDKVDGAEEGEREGRIRGELKAWAGKGLQWAAGLVCLLGIVQLLKGTPLVDRSVAVLVQADHCKWAGSDLPTAVGSRLQSGTLSLVEGIATLRFLNGATVSMEAPTTLQILDRMHCRLMEGSLTAEVPEPAHGFTVETPDLKVIDWGTKFGVSASGVGNSQVRVLEGEVELAGRKELKNRRLNRGEGYHVSTGASLPDQEPQRAQPVHESGGWTSIPTSFGRGRDAYVRRGNSSGATGGSPLLMVKHSELEAARMNERRALITFDLSGADLSGVSEARILLEPKPSGFGFPSLVPDSRFGVYALLNEELDEWSERELAWENVPAASDAGPQVESYRKVGEFWIPRGRAGTVTFGGEGLVKFLRSKMNGLATFLIVRETGESDPSGLVHAFASKEHPGGNPPTLQVR